MYDPGTDAFAVKPGEDLVLTVVANAGYYLDTTSISPSELKLVAVETSRTTDGTGATTYTFEAVEMPEANVGFHVVLKKGYKATMVINGTGYDGGATGWNEGSTLVFPTTTHEAEVGDRKSTRLNSSHRS